MNKSSKLGAALLGVVLAPSFAGAAEPPRDTFSIAQKDCHLIFSARDGTFDATSRRITIFQDGGVLAMGKGERVLVSPKENAPGSRDQLQLTVYGKELNFNRNSFRNAEIDREGTVEVVTTDGNRTSYPAPKDACPSV